jgi:hypothetical protein
VKIINFIIEFDCSENELKTGKPPANIFCLQGYENGDSKTLLKLTKLQTE